MMGRQQAVMYVYLRTGSRFENPADNGLSHFVEHMLFRGTAKHPSSHRLAAAFESLGGTLEAMTAADHGSLGISVPHENLERVIPLIAEVMACPTFSESDIERAIIIEEILEDVNEQGELIDLASLSRALAFEGHGLGAPITGSLKNVEGFTLKQLQAHHGRTYQGQDTVISIAGPVDPEHITKSVESAFGSMQKGLGPLADQPAPHKSGPRYLHVDHPGSSQTSLSLSYRANGRTHPQQAALEMLLRVIDDGMATRLYHEICDARGLCYSVAGSYETYEDAGIVEFEAEATHERAGVVLEQMLRITNELREDLISVEEYQRIRNRTRWQYEALLDDVDGVADFFGAAVLFRTALSPHERLEELQRVTREQIRDVAAEVFVPAGRSVVSVGTQKKAGRSRMRELCAAT